jgi:RNA polymerase sigma factor (sigma-70 family)
VANNCLHNFQRSQRRFRNFLIKLPPATMNDFAEETVARLDDERRMAQILSVLANLRIEDQEVIALCSWAGLSYAEAATALGVPIGTVRSRLSRAHGRLRATLASPPDDTVFADNPSPAFNLADKESRNEHR